MLKDRVCLCSFNHYISVVTLSSIFFQELFVRSATGEGLANSFGFPRIQFQESSLCGLCVRNNRHQASRYVNYAPWNGPEYVRRLVCSFRCIKNKMFKCKVRIVGRVIITLAHSTLMTLHKKDSTFTTYCYGLVKAKKPQGGTHHHRQHLHERLWIEFMVSDNLC